MNSIIGVAYGCSSTATPQGTLDCSPTKNVTTNPSNTTSLVNNKKTLKPGESFFNILQDHHQNKNKRVEPDSTKILPPSQPSQPSKTMFSCSVCGREFTSKQEEPITKTYVPRKILVKTLKTVKAITMKTLHCPLTNPNQWSL